jgi:two-component system, chemotaxis family, chemotaxis protein CheY
MASHDMPILLVDDEPVALDVCTKLLARAGLFDVDRANNGKEALLKLPQRLYGAVISDWNMPELTGLELVWRIRSEDRWAKLPFIMTSVDGTLERAKVARQAGVDAFLIKPFDVVQLTAKLREVVPGLRFRTFIGR